MKRIREQKQGEERAAGKRLSHQRTCKDAKAGKRSRQMHSDSSGFGGTRSGPQDSDQDLPGPSRSPLVSCLRFLMICLEEPFKSAILPARCGIPKLVSIDGVYLASMHHMYCTRNTYINLSSMFRTL